MGDRFYLCDNQILCEYDYEERLVFSNLAAKQQQQQLNDDEQQFNRPVNPPPPSSSAVVVPSSSSAAAGGSVRNNLLINWFWWWRQSLWRWNIKDAIEKDIYIGCNITSSSSSRFNHAVMKNATFNQQRRRGSAGRDQRRWRGEDLYKPWSYSSHIAAAVLPMYSCWLLLRDWI